LVVSVFLFSTNDQRRPRMGSRVRQPSSVYRLPSHVLRLEKRGVTSCFLASKAPTRRLLLSCPLSYFLTLSPSDNLQPIRFPPRLCGEHLSSVSSVISVVRIFPPWPRHHANYG
jgi:hypothetical protein